MPPKNTSGYWPRPYYHVIGSIKVRVFWQGNSYVVVNDATEDYITRVTHAGSQWVSTAYPGKKWGSIKQAVTYVLTMRGME